MEVVINKCYGGYGLSTKALQLYLEKRNIPYVMERRYVIVNDDYFTDFSIHDRHDPVLVEVVKELGEESWGLAAELEIVTVPDNCKYHIDEYDGMEKICDTWYEVSEEDLLKGLSPEKLETLKSVKFIKIR